MHATKEESALRGFLLTKHDFWFQGFIVEKTHQDIVVDVGDVF